MAVPLIVMPSHKTAGTRFTDRSCSLGHVAQTLFRSHVTTRARSPTAAALARSFAAFAGLHSLYLAETGTRSCDLQKL
jgi:hypothetical protein